MAEFKIPLDKKIDYVKFTNEIKERIIQNINNISLTKQGTNINIDIPFITLAELIKLLEQHITNDEVIQSQTNFPIIDFHGNIGRDK